MNYKKLGEVCDVFTDGDWIETKDQSSSGIRLIQTGNIGEGIFLNKAGRSRYISEQTFKRLNCTEIFSGDLLISRLPDPVGRSCIVPDTETRMITAVDCTIVRVNGKKILREFLLFYTNSPAYYTQIREHLSGTTRKRISRGNLAKIRIPLPPLAEQKKIVARLEGLLGKIKEAKRLRAEAQEAAQNLLPAELHRIFTQPIRQAHGKQHTNKLEFVRMSGKPASVKNSGEAQWEEKELGDLVNTIAPPVKIQTKNFKPEGKYPILDQSQNEIAGWTDNVDSIVNIKKPVVIFGDHTCAVKYSEKPFAQGADGIKILNTNNDLLPRFLYLILKNQPIKSEGYRRHFYKLKELKIPLPPVAEQKKIVKHLDGLSEKIKKLQEYQRGTKSDMESLEQSVLHQAFANK